MPILQTWQLETAQSLRRANTTAMLDVKNAPIWVTCSAYALMANSAKHRAYHRDR